MGDLLIRDIPEALKADLARIADRKGESLSETAKSAMLHGLDVVKRLDAQEMALPMGQRLRQIFGGMFETDDEAEEFQRVLDEIRRAPQRPLPDFK
jgi:antitoxin FitA